MNKAYSYRRYSTKASSRDSTPDRQLQQAKEYADKVGLELDNKLTKKGSLGHFLALIKDGTVKPGSVLVIENLDRLSRQGPKATHQFIEQITDRGVGVHVSNLDLTLNKGFENEFFKCIILDAELSRGYREATYKSERIKAGRARRKAQTPEQKA
jgi:DNA invertase Pin-like site-specific DNA recombinase